MENKRSYISPRGILLQFQEFENGLPLRNIGDYKSQLTYGGITEADINEEAYRMLKHVGMGDYIPKCSWQELPQGTIGLAVLTKSKEVEIKLDAETCRDCRVVLATLAHEICHKLLYVNNIFYNNYKDEYAADLCTIYVGFAPLILGGYETSQMVLGYLESQVYKQAYNIVLAVRGEGKTSMVSPDWDVYLSQALDEWCANDDKRMLLETMFSDMSKEIALYNRNVNYLTQLLNVKECILKLNDVCFVQGAFSAVGGGIRKPISVFKMVYDAILERDDENKSITRVNESLSGTIANYVAENNCGNVGDLHCGETYCPVCMAKIDNRWGEGKSVICYCTKCKTNFFLDRRRWDQSAEYIMSLRTQRQNEKALEEMKKQHFKEIAMMRAECEKRLDEARAEGRAQGRNTVSATKYQQGLNDGRNEIIEQISKSPAWLRFFLRKYLKK